MSAIGDSLGQFDLSGRTALVTGARRGIGLAMAVALAEAGADIIGVSAQMETSGNELQQRVEAVGRTCTSVRLDLADRVAVASFCASLAELPPIDILVNNAGMIARSPAADHDIAIWDQVLDVNLRSPFQLAQAAGRSMIARGYGKIIFTASLLSFQGGILVPSYTAAKSGLAGLVKALANEWAPLGVNINAIAPGYIATDNTQALRADADRNAAILARIPTGRWGNASDLAGATVFLASSASDYVSGIVLPVDGGWLGR